ncbi:MAG: hypothetical protein AAF849_09495 [Bacteroidota bacterium]
MKQQYHRRWLLQSVSGLIIVSAGLCMVIEAGIYKSSGVPVWNWVAAGTLSLIVFNAGLCLLVDALRFRMLRDQAEKNDSR